MNIVYGYHTVTEDTLFELGPVDAREFIREMFNGGGRLGYYGYCMWRDWLDKWIPLED